MILWQTCCLKETPIMKSYEESSEFVDGLIYLKVFDRTVAAYGDYQSLERAENEQKTGRLFDFSLSVDEWEANDCNAYLNDGKLSLGIPKEEAYERDAEIIRNERYLRLRQCDKISPMRWNAMTEEQRQAWTDYRIALLNIPQQKGFPWGGDPDKVPWPKEPE